MGAGGQSTEALFDLTGAPSEWLDLKVAENKVNIFEKVFEADKLNYIMNSSTAGQGETQNALGIIAGHAYTLMSAYKLSNGDKLFRLRNPWGKGEWKGTYSDDSSVWTEELKKEVVWENVEDGSFYMKVDDFLTHFTSLSICHYRDTYFRSCIADQNEDCLMACYQFSLEKEGEFYFGVSQAHKNMLPEDHVYGMLSLMIARVTDDGKFEYIGG